MVKNLGKIQYTKSPMSSKETLDLAQSYIANGSSKLSKGKQDLRTRIINDIASLTGGTQTTPGMKKGNKALLVSVLKDKLISVEEYKKLYLDLVDLHKVMLKLKKKTKVPKETSGSKAQAKRDGKSEFTNEATSPGEEVIDMIRKIVKSGSAKKIQDPRGSKKVLVDLYSASAILKIYDAIPPAQKIKYVNQPIAVMAKVAFKLLSK